jgi:hypothetical protein
VNLLRSFRECCSFSDFENNYFQQLWSLGIRCRVGFCILISYVLLFRTLGRVSRSFFWRILPLTGSEQVLLLICLTPLACLVVMLDFLLELLEV